MKNEEVRMKDVPKAAADRPAVANPKPEPGTESQLHNYNVLLTRLGDLFGDDEEPEPPKK